MHRAAQKHFAVVPCCCPSMAHVMNSSLRVRPGITVLNLSKFKWGMHDVLVALPYTFPWPRIFNNLSTWDFISLSTGPFCSVIWTFTNSWSPKQNATELTCAVSQCLLHFFPQGGLFERWRIQSVHVCCPVVITLDSDVASNEASAQRVWLRGNALLDMLDLFSGAMPEIPHLKVTGDGHLDPQNTTPGLHLLR